jgi:hypothetical protein
MSVGAMQEGAVDNPPRTHRRFRYQLYLEIGVGETINVIILSKMETCVLSTC